MNAKFFGALLAAPLAAVSAMIMAAPASAAVFFNNGDYFNFTGTVRGTGIAGQHEFATVGGTFASIGSYGNFGIQAPPLGSKGAFTPFGLISNGAVLASNQILSVDFSNAATYLNKEFLRVSNGTDSFKFIITSLGIPVNSSASSYTNETIRGVFKSLDDEVLGEGEFSSNGLRSPGGSYSANLTVTKVTVPEPSALLGLGLMVGTVFIIRRSQEVSA